VTPPAPPPALSRLSAIVARMQPAFVVIDGGHFDDLPQALRDAGLKARSLFLGQGGRDLERHGPWLLPLASPADTDAVLALTGTSPAAVFWSCQDGETALFAHLRRLNMARLPRWAAMGKPGPEPNLPADLGTEAVLFRHWDPNVLGAMLPVLDAAQFNRILGPAQEIAFHAEEYGGTRRVVCDPNWPQAPTGMLAIRGEQIEALNDRLTETRRRRVTTYLKEVAPHETATFTDPQLRDLVLHSEQTGRDLHLSSDQAHARWAYVMVRTRGNALQQPGLRDYIVDGKVSPDDKVRLLLLTMATVEAHGGHAP